MFSQTSSYAVPHPSGEPLHCQTLVEYRSSARALCRGLEPTATGMARDSLPCLAELILRKHGPKAIPLYLHVCTALRKVCVVMCSLVARSFPELRDEDRQMAQEAWQAALISARHACQQQVNSIGYGGNCSSEHLPSWSSIDECIQKLQPGDPMRLLLLLYTQLRYRGAWATAAPLMNLGHCRVYTPADAHCAPNHEQLFKLADDESKPRAWLVLSKDQKQRADCIYMVVGTQLDASGEERTEHYKLSPALRSEVRAYLSTRPGSVKYLFTPAKHRVDTASSVPYIGTSGRASFLAWSNRQLHSLIGCRLRQLRVAAALHQQQVAKQDLADGQ